MPPFAPITRRELIFFLKRAGFEGPFSGGRHAFMRKENLSLVLPNEHQRDISKGLLLRILKQADISKEKWENL